MSWQCHLFLFHSIFIFILPTLCHLPNSETSSANGIVGSQTSFCAQNSECLSKIRQMAQETGRHWFGDRWRFDCAGHHASSGRQHRHRSNSVECLNPRELSPFLSLGSRLFRVPSFTSSAYLADLRIFPRINFSLQSGKYRACDHDFFEEVEVGYVNVHPESVPLSPFASRNVPDLSWPELRPNASLVVLMLDVGFGTLKYLAVDFPRNTKVLHAYSPIDNFRPSQPTPLVVLIFQPPQPFDDDNGSLLLTASAKEGDEMPFDLGKFMLDNGLDRSLIGMNWALIGADAYGIERQRLKGLADNCHSLVQAKLLRDRRWHFVETFPLDEIDTSLSVSVLRSREKFETCCISVNSDEEQILADPLADRQLPSAAFRHRAPQIVSMRLFQSSENYQRSSRHYVVLKEERFSLAVFSPEKDYLYWLVVDLSADALSAGNLDEAVHVARYLPPVPDRPGECHFVVFMLFRQPHHSAPMTDSFYNQDHAFRSKHCTGHCIYRSSFNVEKFKAFHRLRLAAISWAKVCYDLSEAHFQIDQIHQSSIMPNPVPLADRWVPNESDYKNFEKSKKRAIAEICSRTELDSNENEQRMKLENCPNPNRSIRQTFQLNYLLVWLILIIMSIPFMHCL